MSSDPIEVLRKAIAELRQENIPTLRRATAAQSADAALASLSAPKPSGEVRPNYKHMFMAAVESLAEVSVALGIPDDEASAANGNAEMLARIEELKAAAAPKHKAGDNMEAGAGHAQGSEWVLVRRSDLLAWAQDWQRENAPGDDTDVVTPFDGYLLSAPKPESAEAVAWHTEDHLTDKSATTYDPAVRDRWIAKGWPVTPLYTAPPRPEASGLAHATVQKVVGALSRLGISAPEGHEEQAARADELVTELCDAAGAPQQARADRMAIRMLVAAGFVTKAKVNEALNIAHGFVEGPLEQASAPVGVEAIIEAFDEITGLCRHLRQGGPAPEDLHDLSGALDEAIGIAGNMLDALSQQPAASEVSSGCKADSGGKQPAAHPAITHCDNCGCDWLDNGLNPIGCPYCKQNAWRATFIAERAMRYHKGGMAIEQARIHAETDAARMAVVAASQQQGGA